MKNMKESLNLKWKEPLKLKESLKLIFTAVLNLLMSLTPGRKGAGEAAEGYGTGGSGRKNVWRESGQGVSITAGASEAVLGVPKASLYKAVETPGNHFFKWKIYRHKPQEMQMSPVYCSAQKGQAYADTG